MAELLSPCGLINRSGKAMYVEIWGEGGANQPGVMGRANVFVLNDGDRATFTSQWRYHVVHFLGTEFFLVGPYNSDRPTRMKNLRRYDVCDIPCLGGHYCFDCRWNFEINEDGALDIDRAFIPAACPHPDRVTRP